LPNVSGLRLQSMTSASITHIDSDAQRQHYQTWSNAYHQTLQNTLQNAGIRLLSLLADAPLQALNTASPSPVMDSSSTAAGSESIHSTPLTAGTRV
ncbi:MAG: hypothetical protein GXO35_04360, partial [Gammaproteobacteria bacterium]|nr:hypothetical protein [Gammaproteobacteria bacterium]